MLGVVVAVVVAACSSSEKAVDAPIDAGRAPVVDAGRDVTIAPPSSQYTTPRCTDPKPSPGVYVPPPFPEPVPVDAGAPDADAGRADAGADSGAAASIVSGPIRPLRLPSQGGPVLAMPRWIPIFFQDTEDRLELEDFLGSVGCTDYWRAVASEYGVGEGISAPSVLIPEDGPLKISDEQIQKWLAKQIQNGTVEAPTPNSLYVIFYPPSTVIGDGGDRSCYGFGGYHNELTAGASKTAYAVIPRCGNFERITSTTTHELVEAATDPYVRSDPAYYTPADADLPWSYVAGGENADLCTFIQGSQITFGDYPYTVQRSFSNKASIEGHDPCVPASRPYFYAAPSLESSVMCADCGNIPVNAIHVPAGTSKVVDVTLGADAPVGVFQVEVVHGSDLYLQVESGSGSTYVLDKSFGEAGQHLQMTITASSSASETEFFALSASRVGRTNYWYGAVVH